MTSLLRASALLCCALIATSRLCAQAAQRQSALILEKRGSIGRIAVGANVDSAGAELRRLAGQTGSYESPDGSILVETDTNGSIKTIRTANRSFLTTRSIRPGRSTLEEVLRAYGAPSSVTPQGDQLIVAYDGITFSFHYQPSAASTDTGFDKLLRVPVKAITLTTRSTQKH